MSGWTVDCPYCEKECEVGDNDIFDEEVDYECEYCKKTFICWGESSYDYYAKKKKEQEQN